MSTIKVEHLFSFTHMKYFLLITMIYNLKAEYLKVNDELLYTTLLYFISTIICIVPFLFQHMCK